MMGMLSFPSSWFKVTGASHTHAPGSVLLACGNVKSECGVYRKQGWLTKCGEGIDACRQGQLYAMQGGHG